MFLLKIELKFQVLEIQGMCLMLFDDFVLNLNIVLLFYKIIVIIIFKYIDIIMLYELLVGY